MGHFIERDIFIGKFSSREVIFLGLSTDVMQMGEDVFLLQKTTHESQVFIF